MKTLSAFVLLSAALVAVPADAGNCRVGYAQSYGTAYQQTYVAATPAYNYSYQNYTQVVPYAVPAYYVPDTMYRVDSALAYARIAEAAAEAAVNKQNQNMLSLFQDFLRQQAQLQQPRSQAGELPPVPQPPKASNPSPALAVNQYLAANCASCHKPNTKRWDLTRDAAKLTKAELDEVMHRVMAPDDDKEVMPPPEKWKDKQRPTKIEDINAIHSLRKGAK